MISTAFWGILGLAATTWVIFNLLSYRKFRNSLPREGGIQRRIVTWAELILPPMRNISLSTRNFIGESYTSRAPNGFTFWAIILVVVAGAICFVGIIGEYGFSQFTLADFLGETPDSATLLFGFPLSSVLAAMIVVVAILAGLVLFEQLGGQQPPPIANPGNAENAPLGERTAEIERRKKNYLLKLAAGNVLVAIAAFQAFLGFQRGNEFILAANFQEQIMGNASVVNAANSLAVSLLNAFLGILMPFITAFTARYLLTFGMWILASATAVLLFLVLWLPTWALNGAVVRYQQQYGSPRIENAPNETESQPPPLGGERYATPQNPPADGDATAGATGGVTDDGNTPNDTAEGASSQAANERYEEEQERLRDFEEAERRRREQANSNPFGI